MKMLLLAISTLLVPSFTFAQTQGEMNHTSLIDFQKSDAKLNAVYTKILASLDDNGKEKLKTSERAWLAYREAQAKFEADVVARGGTMAPLIYNECRVVLTDARIKELQKSVAVR
jgi:uncharacterized protein YecT (DUF1311 family)